jgi:L-lactate utilization protein LutB
MKEETSTRGSDPFGGYVNRSLACHIYHTVKRQEESMDAKQTYYQNVSKTIINNLKKRQMEGYYCQTSSEARELILSLMPSGSSISWGGSLTLEQTGILDAIKKAEYVVYDRSQALSKEERKELYSHVIGCDHFLMSTNAITLEGELVNIDNTGNRISFLCFGPDSVIVVAGMNKVVPDVDSGMKRVQNVASPPNTTRLGRKTPCAVTGRCADCLVSDTICAQKLVTRYSPTPGRIKVVLIGEELGF